MVIVDDHVGLLTLAGHSPVDVADGVPAIPWCFHFRMVRAVLDNRLRGRLTGDLDHRVVQAAIAPPAAMLRVLDPRPLTVAAARLMAQYPLSMVAAELLAAGVVFGSPVHIAEANVGRSWHHVADAEGVTLHVESGGYAP